MSVDTTGFSSIKRKLIVYSFMIFIICLTSYRFKHSKPNKFHFCYNFTIKTIKTLQNYLSSVINISSFHFHMSVCAFQLPIVQALSYLSVRLRLRKFCRSIKILQVRWIQGDIFHKGPPQQCSWISIKEDIIPYIHYFNVFDFI